MPAKKTATKRKPAKRKATKKRVTKKRVTKKTPVKRSVGRPTKYSKAMAERLPDMFKSGEDVIEVCVELGISKDTFYRWVKEHPEFSDAYEKGKEFSEAWWNRLIRGGAMGRIKVQPATLIFCMKNKFGWKDRIETQHSGEIASRLVIGNDMSVEDWEAAARRQQAIMRGATDLDGAVE